MEFLSLNNTTTHPPLFFMDMDNNSLKQGLPQLIKIGTQCLHIRENV